MCLAVNIAHLVSASSTLIDTSSLKYDATDLVLALLELAANSLCCLLVVVTLFRPPWEIEKSERHRVHLAYSSPAFQVTAVFKNLEEATFMIQLNSSIHFGLIGTIFFS